MVATQTVPQDLQHCNFKPITPRHGVGTLFGYGINVHVDRGPLSLRDGIGPNRRSARFPHVGHGLNSSRSALPLAPLVHSSATFRRSNNSPCSTQAACRNCTSFPRLLLLLLARLNPSVRPSSILSICGWHSLGDFPLCKRRFAFPAAHPNGYDGLCVGPFGLPARS